MYYNYNIDDDVSVVEVVDDVDDDGDVVDDDDDDDDEDDEIYMSMSQEAFCASRSSRDAHGIVTRGILRRNLQ